MFFVYVGLQIEVHKQYKHEQVLNGANHGQCLGPSALKEENRIHEMNDEYEELRLEINLENSTELMTECAKERCSFRIRTN